MGFLNNLRMRTRLLGAFAITTLITLLIGLLGMNATGQQAAVMSSMYDNQLIPIQDLSNANMQALYISRNLNTYVVLDDPGEVARLKSTIAERMRNYRELMAKYQTSQLTPKEVALIGKLESAWPIYLAAEAKVFQLADEGKDAEAFTAISEDALPKFKVIDDLLSELVDLNASIAKEVDLASDADYAEVRNLIIAAIAIAVVLSGALAMVITNSVTGPLAQGIKVAEAVAAGDLTVEVNSKGSDEVAQLLRPLAEAKGLGFRLACAPSLPAALLGDATRLRQILFNLGHNAIKFCDAGGISLRVDPGLPEGLVLSVHDSGPGLGQEEQARLFRRFEQGGAGSGSGGTGLGLAICRELAVAMGGGIWVQSAPGPGAHFRVSLPLPAVAPPPVGTRAVRQPSAARRLLLVEDDAVVADVVAALLQQQGHQVRHVPHGLAALAELAAGDYDLAVLDLDLPGIDGLQLARLLRARGETLPLLALTARADPQAEPEARAAGMDGFLRKPVTGELLAGAIAGLAPALPRGLSPGG